MAKIIISDFSSLSFSKSWQQDFQQPECYVQSFAQTDTIRVQVASEFKLDYILTNLETSERMKIKPTIGIAQDVMLPSLEIGLYKLEIKIASQVFASTKFMIMDDASLTNTVVFRYTNDENRFNTEFIWDEEERYFDYRVEGGFINKDRKLDVENNDFRDQEYSLHMLDAFPYSTSVLTIGESDGVPIWVGEKINLIMSLSETQINGVEWTRASGSAPELVEVKDYYPLYVFKIEVERENMFGEEHEIILKVLGTQNDKMVTTQTDNGILI